jgi:hypothetical protein
MVPGSSGGSQKDRTSASIGSDKLFARAIGIVERAIADEAPAETPPKSAVAKDGK